MAPVPRHRREPQRPPRFDRNQLGPARTQQWLGTLPPGKQNDAALDQFAQTIAADDPESAAHWASSITERAKRYQTLNQVVAQWRVSDPIAAAKFEQSQAKP